MRPYRIPPARIGVAVVLSAALLSCAVVVGSLRSAAQSPKNAEMKMFAPPVEDTVAAFSTNVWVVRFAGLRPARLHVSAGARISCFVYGPSGSRVDGRALESCDRTWIPEHTGAYRVEVRNPGRTATPYKLWISSEHAGLGRCALTVGCPQ